MDAHLAMARSECRTYDLRPMTYDLSHLNKCQKPETPCGTSGFKGVADDGLLSHDLAVEVPSTLQGLTTVFGMGTGVAPAR